GVSGVRQAPEAARDIPTDEDDEAEGWTLIAAIYARKSAHHVRGVPAGGEAIETAHTLKQSRRDGARDDPQRDIPRHRSLELSRKCDRGGRVNAREIRPQAQWLPIEVPELRSMDQSPWQLVQQRIARNGETY